MTRRDNVRKHRADSSPATQPSLRLRTERRRAAAKRAKAGRKAARR